MGDRETPRSPTRPRILTDLDAIPNRSQAVLIRPVLRLPCMAPCAR